MKLETLKTLEEQVFNKSFTVYGNQEQAFKAYNFITALRKANIPLSSIDISDFSTTSVIVFIGYDERNWIFKKYKRFSKYDLQNAIKFYNGE